MNQMLCAAGIDTFIIYIVEYLVWRRVLNKNCLRCNIHPISGMSGTCSEKSRFVPSDRLILLSCSTKMSYVSSLLLLFHFVWLLSFLSCTFILYRFTLSCLFCINFFNFQLCNLSSRSRFSNDI